MGFTLTKNIPNIITLSRLALVLPFMVFIHDNIVYNCINTFSLIVFVSIIFSDIIDGFLARKWNCTSMVGAKLDIISDAVYTILSLSIFVYFKIIPIWFPVIVIIKLLEFIITSKIIKNIKKSNSHLIFDNIGKTAVNIVMLLPGIFVFRCIIDNYKMVMNIFVYIVTILFIISFISRIVNIIKNRLFF